MANYVHPVVDRKAGIDGKTVGNTTLHTTPNDSQRFFFTSLIIELTAVAALVTPATFSLGTNSPNYNNLLGATLLGTLGAANDSIIYAAGGMTPSVPVSTAIVLRITIGAVATTFTIRAALLGIYE